VRTVRRLDRSDARRLVDAALERAAAIGVPMCVAVCDESGVLIAFERMDEGKVSGVSLAIDKAYTAAAARKSTAFYADDSNPASPGARIQGTDGGRFTRLRGGVPVEVSSSVVGAIGVSGGTGPQDVDVAEHAIMRFLGD
jgi:uncharacterized protein GlcG (DUF336 family)